MSQVMPTPDIEQSEAALAHLELLQEQVLHLRLPV